MAKSARRPRRTGDAGLDEALAATFPASDPPAQTNPSQGVRIEHEMRGVSDARLDEALAETFPASDPPAQTNPSKSTRVDGECLREILDLHGTRKASVAATR